MPKCIYPHATAESEKPVEVPVTRLPTLPSDAEIDESVRLLDIKAARYHRGRAETVRPARKVRR